MICVHYYHQSAYIVEIEWRNIIFGIVVSLNLCFLYFTLQLSLEIQESISLKEKLVWMQRAITDFNIMLPCFQLKWTTKMKIEFFITSHFIICIRLAKLKLTIACIIDSFHCFLRFVWTWNHLFSSEKKRWKTKWAYETFLMILVLFLKRYNVISLCGWHWASNISSA